MRGAFAIAVAATAAACTTPMVQGRFADQPVVWEVDDRRHVDEPRERRFMTRSYIANVLLFRRLTRMIDPPGEKPALNVNALDEVPDSTWFTNRIGLGRVEPSDAARGDAGSGPPEPPLRVVVPRHDERGGLYVRDARGMHYLVQVDEAERPAQRTGAAIVANRVLWTLGFNVLPEHIVYVHPDDVRIGPGTRELTAEALSEMLATAPARADGTRRLLATELVPGVPKGGWPPEGVRDDDPNDRVPHEHRRELRALRVFAAWLGHTNMREDNTLDLYVMERGKRFLRHYLVDFTDALGGHRSESGRLEVGWEYAFDWKGQGKALITFGLLQRPWEEQEEAPFESVGVYSGEHFDPTRWREYYPYWPFMQMGAADAFWAAKAVMRFDRPVLEAIVQQAQYTEPGVDGYLVQVMLARRDAIGAAYLDRVTALDRFRFEGPGRLCATDLALAYGFAQGGVLEELDDGNRVAALHAFDGDGVCLAVPRHEDYRIFRLRTRRGETARPVMQIHVRGGPSPRLLGIVRVEWFR